MDVRLSFGEWLEDQLRQRRWSQVAFADAVGVARQTVSGWINNAQPPRRRAARDIARVLGVDINEVLVRAGYPPLDPEYQLPALALNEEPASYDPSPLDDPELTLWASYLGELDPHDKRILEELVRTMIRNKRED